VTYLETIEFLYSLRLFGLKLGLENTRRLAAQAGNPQDRLRFIHIAGTNGKGSVAALLESLYRAAGLRVGLYTSPHLVTFRERIQVNRQMIREADVVRLAAELRRQGSAGVPSASPVPPAPSDLQQHSPASRSEGDACPTFFEFVTVMALQYFAEQSCDLVIWETGMGGRLDATNIVTPLASVITNIDLDHQPWLGHDFRSIAIEKAGIIKPHIPVITATAEPEALAVIQETALACGSALTLVTPAHTTHPPLDTIRLPLLGWHQRLNAATALATVHALQPALPVSEPAIRRGLETVQWAGRLQLVERPIARTADQDLGAMSGPPERRRRILLDGAHNPAGAAMLRAALEEEFGGVRPALILGILGDKDWTVMCEVLAPVAAEIFCVRVKSDRSADPHQLAEACRKTAHTAQVTVVDSVGQALEQTTGAALTVVAGSLYLIGETLDRLTPGGPSVADERILNEYGAPP
jgi:dihydrofolate synthase/folylpolyglutamate synthase